jgi:trigger factor
MQPIIKNTFDKKLKKEYHITLPAQLLNKNVNDYIEKVKGTYNLNGFRKGQVPAQIILEKHGLAILADEVEKLISENIQKIVTDNKLKLALKPKADLKTMELNKGCGNQCYTRIIPRN